MQCKCSVGGSPVRHRCMQASMTDSSRGHPGCICAIRKLQAGCKKRASRGSSKARDPQFGCLCSQCKNFAAWHRADSPYPSRGMSTPPPNNSQLPKEFLESYFSKPLNSGSKGFFMKFLIEILTFSQKTFRSCSE